MNKEMMSEEEEGCQNYLVIKLEDSKLSKVETGDRFLHNGQILTVALDADGDAVLYDETKTAQYPGELVESGFKLRYMDPSLG